MNWLQSKYIPRACETHKDAEEYRAGCAEFYEADCAVPVTRGDAAGVTLKWHSPAFTCLISQTHSCLVMVCHPCLQVSLTQKQKTPLPFFSSMYKMSCGVEADILILNTAIHTHTHLQNVVRQKCPRGLLGASWSSSISVSVCRSGFHPFFSGTSNFVFFGLIARCPLNEFVKFQILAFIHCETSSGL